jgi:hypothetical protein
LSVLVSQLVLWFGAGPGDLATYLLAGLCLPVLVFRLVTWDE